MELSSEFEATLLDAKQFAAYPHLEALLSMVNEAFDIRHREVFATHDEGRFGSLKELVESLDTVGRCCIITQTQKNQAPRIVAFSILKAYFEHELVARLASLREAAQDISTRNGANGTRTSLTPATLNAKNGDPDIDIRSVSDWELGVVVVRQDPQLSKLGLAVRCAALLEQDLMERLERAEKGDANGAIKPVDQQQPLTFWIKTAAAVNGSYWQRRGHKVHPIAVVEAEPSWWCPELLKNGVAATCTELYILWRTLHLTGALTGRITKPSDTPAEDICNYLPRFQEDALAANRGFVDKVISFVQRKK
ncbi:hypothetical protein GX51_04597 [Blastomyces parvus]|uniref:Uncharacterized protein n=1 Tax=Blastomyces parvus TaxID=2060905 RepID=A0A2B7X162_9EURO|nr:hypothetical protein GX51_04597 [Blastomyces parvus]